MDPSAGLIGAVISLLSAPLVVRGWQWWLKRLDARRSDELAARKDLNDQVASLRVRLEDQSRHITELTAANARMEAQIESLREDIVQYERVRISRDELRAEVERLRALAWQHGIDPSPRAASSRAPTDPPLPPPESA